VTTTDVSRAFTGLTPNTNYQFQVKAENLGAAGTYSAYSASSTVTTTVPVDVTLPVVSAVESSSLTVSWTDGVNGGTPVYQISSADNGFASVTTTALTSDLTGLTPSSSYTFTVKVQKPDSTYTTGVATTATTTLAEEVPNDPTGLTATAASVSQINLAWTAVVGATSYKVYSSADSYTTAIASPSTNSYSVTSLSASTAYTYKVSAVNGAGEGEKSDSATATTSAAPSSGGGGGGGSAPAAPAVPITIVSPIIGGEFDLGMTTGVLVGNTHHQVTFVSFDSRTEVVTLQIKSTLFKVPLKVGEERVVDSDLDNLNDLYLKLNSIDSTKKNINLTLVSLIDLEFAVNYNFSITNQQDTVLYFNSPTAVQVAISNSSDFSQASFEPYQRTKQWRLSSGSGTKTVYVKLRTAQGGEKVVTDSILFDPKYPYAGKYVVEKNTIITEEAANFPVVSVPKVAYTFTRVLKVGSTGADVKVLQTLLKKLGYFTYPNITSYFGTITKQSLIKYQTANKLKATGIVDAATLKYLNSQSAAEAEKTTTATVADKTSTSLIPQDFVFYHYLARGMNGLEVKYLQIRLQELGYMSEDIKANGIFGPATQAAVIKLQKNKGLRPAVGFVGPATRAVLNQ